MKRLFAAVLVLAVLGVAGCGSDKPATKATEAASQAQQEPTGPASSAKDPSFPGTATMMFWSVTVSDVTVGGDPVEPAGQYVKMRVVFKNVSDMTQEADTLDTKVFLGSDGVDGGLDYGDPATGAVQAGQSRTAMPEFKVPDGGVPSGPSVIQVTDNITQDMVSFTGKVG